MYFDDCEREEDVTPLSSSCSSSSSQQQQQQQLWIMSQSEEKQLALDRLLGYNFQSALNLDDEKIEDEILQWAIDTKVLWDGDEQQSNKKKYKYISLSDLVVESSCTTPEECLASLWKTLSGLLQNRAVDSVHWLVFPRCSALWDYDTMVTVLQAIQVSRPQIGMQIAMDLFHPKYKNAPTMFSPETHSPFPTVALQVRGDIQSSSSSSSSSLDVDDAAMTRSKLEALFDSVDAVPEIPEMRREKTAMTTTSLSPDKILQDCQLWLHVDDVDDMKWTVEAHEQPFHVYAALWDVIRQLAGTSSSSSSTDMVVAPNLDAHTLHRVAVTVNAALQHMKSRVRVVNVYHPSNPDASRKSPHAMIQLAFK
jgi:hypothetical protein